MLLTVDCGNTNIVFALYDGDEQRANWRISTDAKRSGDEYFVWLTQLMMLRNIDIAAVKDIIIASVVPEVQPKLVNLAIRGFNLTPMVVGAANVKLGIDVRIDRPDQAGADRLVNAVAAHHCYDLPAIVLDFGTATTLDLIGAGGTYEGGIIAPGVNLSVEALYLAAARLPRLAVEPWAKDMPALGKDTVSAMHSGIFWGYVSMVQGLIARLGDEVGRPLPAIATGGLAPLFADHVPEISVVDPDLTLKGLVYIHRLNQGMNDKVDDR
jgi:type III pantothenate kinase